MYENGKRVNGYKRKRIHKRKMKQRHADNWFYGSGSKTMSWPEFKAYAEAQMADPIYGEFRSHILDYWKTSYLTGPRQYAKRETARRSRQQFREAVNKCADWNDFEGLPSYHKVFDYAWTVW